MKLQTRSDRLNLLPKYLFAALDEKKRELIAKGVDVINLGIGDPDLPPPPRMVEALTEALATPEFHQYPSYNGAGFFREDIAEWLLSEHNVTADPASEIVVLIGTKEGLAHLPQAVLNPGDSALITDPSYPVHLQAMLLAGVVPFAISLYEANNFLPDLSTVSEKQWKDAKMIVLNYPNNPTSARATEGFFKELINLAHKYNFIICHDAAYIDICLDGKKQTSLMSLPGAKDVAIEFFTFSKMFNICGWRMGFCVGNKELVGSLGKFKTACDSGQFTALQKAVSVGLKECLPDVEKTREIYKKRRGVLCEGLDKMGLPHFNSGSTFYVWCRVPGGLNSTEYANKLLEEMGIVTTPGAGFGKMGDKFVRFSLTSPTERIKEATERMGRD